MIDSFIQLAIAPRYYKALESARKLSADELVAYQVQQLKRVLIYSAEKVPYYNKLFREATFDPSTFRYLDDINKIPFLDKETVRTHSQELISDDWQKLGVKFCHTSGSSGTPLLIPQDRISRAAKYALVYYYRHLAGYNLHDRVFSLWGVYATTKQYPYGIDRIKNMVYYANNKMTEENSCNVGKLLNSFKPVQFEGYAKSFLELGLCLQRNNIPIWSPKSIFCYGDCLTDKVRATLENMYHTKVYDFYSHVENAVAIAEIEPNNKVLVEGYCYPELIPDKNGLSELVSTSFYNYAMPLIRYKTNDVVQISVDGQIDNTSYRKVSSILGRQNDYLIMPDGRCILSIQRAIYGITGIMASQFVQKTHTDVDLRIVADDTFRTDSIDKIKKSLNLVCGEEINLNVIVVETLEKNRSGKAPFVIRYIDEK